MQIRMHILEEATMRVVHVRVSQTDFGGVFEAMREWLDRKNCTLEHFGTEAGERGICRGRLGGAIPARVSGKLRRLSVRISGVRLGRLRSRRSHATVAPRQ